MTEDNYDHDFEEVPPDASGMIEGLRAGGYSLATALADIIDNSITAGSRNVWLRMEWEGDDSWISITDDGRGMAEDELKQAMRLASTHPLEQRDERDLGRFGLGLKTASFSQARRLTVLSRVKGGHDALRRWDLDHLARPDVQGWQLLRTPHKNTGAKLNQLDDQKLESGTVVLLEELDRVVRRAGANQLDDSSEKYWVKQVDCVRQHLGMVFHRFLERQGASRLKIHING
ncbi:MAG TPA: ATP-binding protein, partial [Candidatus Obscuribacterales bacterium]